MILYNLKTSDGEYRITKFDDDFNPISSYIVSESACECPRGQTGKVCRHRIMLPTMVDRVDSPWFYCLEENSWHDPTGGAGNSTLAEAVKPEPTAADIDLNAVGATIKAYGPIQSMRRRC